MGLNEEPDKSIVADNNNFLAKEDKCLQEDFISRKEELERPNEDLDSVRATDHKHSPYNE